MANAELEWSEMKLMKYGAALVLLLSAIWLLKSLVPGLTVAASIAAGVIALVALVWTTCRVLIRIVHEEQQMVIERWGKYRKTVGAGFHILWPWDRPRKVVWWFEAEAIDGTRRFLGSTARIDTREDVLNMPPSKVITKDNALVEINAAVYIKIVDAKKVAYGATEPLREIELLVQTILRGFIAELDLDDALQGRQAIINRLNTDLKPLAADWGIDVLRVEVQTIIPSPDIENAMEKQLTAARLSRAALEGARANAEVEVIKAEAYQRSRALMAEADTSALRRQAEAEADAIKTLAGSLPPTGDPTRAIVALRYIETWKQMISGSNTKVVYLPYETSPILGALAGIREPSEPRTSVLK
jgi:regulator of protease activity HflC (stomatin/prohibitin superfamily)